MLFQAAVVGFFLVVAHLESVETGKPPAIGAALLIGAIVAAFLTALLTRAFDRTRRLLRQKRARDDAGPIVAARGELLDHPNPVRVEREIGERPRLPTQPRLR